MGKKSLATVCFSIAFHRVWANILTNIQRQEGNENFNKTKNNNFARASRFYFCISLPFLHDYDVKMPNSAFYGERKQATTKFILLFALELGIQLYLGSPTNIQRNTEYPQQARVKAAIVSVSKCARA